MNKGFSSVNCRNSAVEKSVHPMLAIRISALVFFASAAFSTQGKVLVYEGFHEGDWTGISATATQQIQQGKTSGNYTFGFAKNSQWSVSDTTTQLQVSKTTQGLSLPDVMTAKGFTTCGGAAQCNPSQNNSQLRGGCHAFTNNTLKVSSGTLYIRCLLRLTSGGAAKLSSVTTPAGNADGSYYGFGIIGSTSADRYPLTKTSYKSSCSFLMWKDSVSKTNVLSLCLIDASGTLTHYPLVTGITYSSTYLCYAEINVGVGTGGAEYIRAGAIDTADFTGAAPWAALDGASDTIEVQLITDSYYPKAMAFAGCYGTNNGSFRADELVVGTEFGDILPAGGVFAVSQSGAPTVGIDSFSTDWTLMADQGVTADAGLVWSTDDSFATATTNSLGTGLAADTRTATLTDLEPDTTYWWKIYAYNGTETAETPVGSFTTTGAPILGSATVTATAAAETATFSVALTEAAMENTLTTSVSVFYGTNGVDWAELPLGSASGAESFSDTVGNLGYGVTYKWFACATATMEGGRVLSNSTATNSFTTLWNGDMYVDAGAANTTKPYLSPGTAAKTIAAAITLAADGATIHVAPGRYTISSPLSLTKAIELVGDNADPSRVVVSNKESVAWGNTNHRCILLNNPNAIASGMTFENGKDYADGGNVRIDANGGMVTNCVMINGFTREDAASGGANVAIKGPGIVTHCRIFGGEQSNCSGGDRASSVFLEHANARIENCLVEGFKGATVSTQPTKNAGGVVVGQGAAVNCTVVNCRSPYTTASGFAGILLWENGVATNCVSVCNVDSNGTLRAFSSGQVSRTSHCAFDAIAGAATIPAGMPNAVVGTAESFFNDYANGDYTLNPTSLLVNAGANYDGMASVDLAGRRRKVGGRVDIGCYELQSKGLTMVIR